MLADNGATHFRAIANLAMPPLILVGRQGKQFLELVDNQYDTGTESGSRTTILSVAADRAPADWSVRRKQPGWSLGNLKTCSHTLGEPHLPGPVII